MSPVFSHVTSLIILVSQGVLLIVAWGLVARFVSKLARALASSLGLPWRQSTATLKRKPGKTSRSQSTAAEGKTRNGSNSPVEGASINGVRQGGRASKSQTILAAISPVSAARSEPTPGSELRAVLAACRGALIGIALMTSLLNVLYLTGSIFMLEVYDRVLPSRSMPTLVGLVMVAALLFAFQAVLDLLRGRVLVRIGAWLDEAVSLRAYEVLTQLPLRATGISGSQPLRDLDQIRGFLSGAGPPALFDLPWMPLYLAVCFAFHPLIGLTATAGGLLLVLMTLLTETLTRIPVKAAAIQGAQRHVLAEASRRNAEVLQAMGMAGGLAAVWGQCNAAFRASNQRAADIIGGFSAVSKVLRMVLQSAVLAVGAYLVIEQEATPGIIIASSILTSRALAPVELAIGNWKGFVQARQSWARLGELLRKLPVATDPMALPKPETSFAVEGVSVVPPGDQKIVVQDITFRLSAGSGLGIIGPSASGKSSLARVLVGAWQPLRGKIRLDGAALDQWSPEALGRHVGYLPQDIELFAGTIAQNISRFVVEPDADEVIAAARAAGVHEMVLQLPNGYETQIGEGGAALSAGQRQRVALARALYGGPFLVVLDEPNSNLDAEGEEALTRAVGSVRDRGGILIVIAHRPSALAGVDLLLAMKGGSLQAFGPKEEVLAKVTRRVASPRDTPTVPFPSKIEPLRVVGDQQEATS